jgi:hypothetical protein
MHIVVYFKYKHKKCMEYFNKSSIGTITYEAYPKSKVSIIIIDQKSALLKIFYMIILYYLYTILPYSCRSYRDIFVVDLEAFVC